MATTTGPKRAIETYEHRPMSQVHPQSVASLESDHHLLAPALRLIELRDQPANTSRRLPRRSLSSPCLRWGRALPTIVLALMVTARDVRAATIVVGAGGCRLDHAIQAANTNTAVGSCTAGGTGGDTITFEPTNATYLINTQYGAALPDITSAITIQGNGNTTLNAEGAFRVLNVTSSGSLTLTNATIVGGHADIGGGIRSTSGTVTLTNVNIHDNSATSDGGGMSVNTASLTNVTLTGNSAGRDGGGMSTGTANLSNVTISANSAVRDGGGIKAAWNTDQTLTNSTVSGNSAGSGGGIAKTYAGLGYPGCCGDLILTKVTLSGNSASGGGGGIRAVYTTMRLTNATVSGNSAGGVGGISGGICDLILMHATITKNSGTVGGIALTSASGQNLWSFFQSQNSIVASQTSGPDCNSGTLYSDLGYNLESSTTCQFTHPNDRQNGNAALLPLTLNAPGTTKTHALGAGSEALDRIPLGANGCGTTITTDQRGMTRPQNGNCDVGAYETYSWMSLPTRHFGPAVPHDAYAGDPVNTATGNYAYTYTDLSLPTRSAPLAFTRAYNSVLPAAGPLGYDWTHAYAISAIDAATDVVIIRHGDGREEPFLRNGDVYDPLPGTFSALEKIGGNYRLTLRDQTVYDFNAQGQLVTITDRNGHMTTLNYTAGRLTTIGPPARSDCNGDGSLGAADIATAVLRIFNSATRGDPVACDANGDNHIDAGDLSCTTLRLFQGPAACPVPLTGTERLLTLAYDGQGRITSVHDHTGRTVNYGYNGAGDLITVTDVTGSVTTYSYDTNHRILTMMDAKGHTFVTNAYNADGRVVDQADALGKHTSFSYDTVNRRTSVTDPLTHTTRYDYDANMRLIAVVNALGQTESYTYDAENNRLMVTDRRGGITRFMYDSMGNTLRVTDTVGNARVMTFDAASNLLTDRDPRGNTTAYQYDTRSNLLRRTDPLVNPTTYAYDARGRLASTTDALSRTTGFQYDIWSARTQATDAAGGVTSSTYDPAGRKLTDTDALGRVTGYAYDAANRIAVITDTLGGTTSNAYDAVGNRTAVTDANGHTTTFAYTAKDQLASVTDALGHATSFTYDAAGNQTRMTDPLGRNANFTYDALNRRLTATDANTNTITYGYDAVSNRTSARDALNRTTTFTYTLDNRLTGVRDAASGVVTYTYDAAGNRTAMTDAKNHTTTYAYDALNRLASTTDPLGQATTYAYDAVGNRATVTKPDGTQVQVAFDDLDRPVATTAPTLTITQTYDVVGNRVSQTDATGTTTYQYDAHNRLTQVTWANGRVVGYAYDAVGNRTRLTYPGGSAVDYQYDAADRMTHLTDWNSNVVQYTYDAAGQLTNTMLANGTTTAYSYDPGGRAAGITHRHGASVLENFGYTYNAVDDRLSETRVGGAKTFGYDTLHRLTSATYPTPITVTYAYDPMGNRTTLTSTGSAAIGYTYDAADRMLTAGPTSFGWDANGRMTTRLAPPITTTYAYDPLDRLAQAIDGTTSSQYGYTGDGVRVGKTVSGTVTSYVPDVAGVLPMVLVETTGGQDTRYVYGLGQVAAVLPNGTYRWQHTDAIGSVRLQTDGAGNVVATRDYDAFGEVRASTGTWSGVFGYAGEQGDGETGLTYLRARYYEPDTGRFMIRDLRVGLMIDAMGQNPYQYGRCNPVRFVDRDGKIVIEAATLVCLAYSTYQVLNDAHRVVGSPILGAERETWQTAMQRRSVSTIASLVRVSCLGPIIQLLMPDPVYGAPTYAGPPDPSHETNGPLQSNQPPGAAK